MTATPLNMFKMTGTRIDSLVSSDLTEIIVPTGVTEIKEYAFALSTHNSRIQRIIIPDSVIKIGAFAMRHCDNLTEVRLPNNLPRLETYTFHDCKNLRHIILPEGLKTIDRHAMTTCGVTEIIIPKSVERIGEAAFMSCANLRTVIIPSRTTLLDKGVFYKCGNLTIYTTHGSAAEAYAKEYNIPYKYIDHAIPSTTPAPTPTPSPSPAHTPLIPVDNEDNLSFADELSKVTKTKQQVRDEVKQENTHIIDEFIKSNVEGIINSVEYQCKQLASKAERKLMHDFHISPGHYVSTAFKKEGGKRAAYKKIRDLVLADLQEKGFRTLHVTLRSEALHIYIRW